MAAKIITLTSDFGASDAFVGVLKGVLLNICPDARLVDLNHGIPPHDVFETAWSVAQAAPEFPPGTIHLVGTATGDEAGLIVHAGDQFYVAPDNGALSLIYARDASAECVVRRISAMHYARPRRGTTFLARDLLAPVAAWLARGTAAEKFGERVQEFRRFALPQPRLDSDALRGVILRVDRFGNLVSNVLPAALPPEWTRGGQTRVRLRVGSMDFPGVVRAYGEGPADTPFAVWGADEFLEISARNASAARLTGAQRGAAISITPAVE